ncbi:hypothetical protein Mpsy_0653 [Methanolobus psychrophilus R15]|nr:hypothetical protein Mpsy_0653 [Methanolobus psychrophilus R15]
MKGIDAATKVLTEIGWKGYDEIVESDRVAIYSLYDEKIKYERISGLSLEEYEGKMYSISNRWNDFFVPPESSLILKYIKSTTHGKKFTEDTWHVEKIKDITPHGGYLIINSGEYDGEIEIGEFQAMLIGWIISTGYKNDDGVIEIHQSIESNKEDMDILFDMLSSLEIEHTTESARTTVANEWFETQIVKIVDTKENKWIYDSFDEKFRPKWNLLHLKNEELGMLYEGMNLANNAYFEGDRIIYINNNVSVQEFYRVLCLHLGYITHYVIKRRAYSALTIEVDERNYSNVFHANYHDTFKEIENFKGALWHPKLTNQHFVVKRNDKIFIVGV